ncbi:hypothetical protein [Micromonospora coxensis]|uniref:Uncharacterized protein n=1 Tax=Micromonospora coxensis TaxID=356852 RepID=A0A1C5IYD7_9ACTN|nr:hypothetical protein [Micromonospora coxensis]SCG63352.1 hypothetical protein GA0070614_3633 [Micromonospora coxensis]
MDQEFRDLIDSLGNMTADRVRDFPVSKIRIVANEDLCTAQVTAFVTHALTDKEYTALMTRMIGAREFYFDELSIGFSISLGETEDFDGTAEAAGSREFAYSGC